MIIGAEDPAYAGGSYVIVQKYLHDMDAWNALPTEQQEKVIGRTKLADIELDDDGQAVVRAQRADDDHRERQGGEDRPRQHAVRARSGAGEYGTYFIGYARSPATTELMLQNMFIGRPEGNYDRILDVSRAVTGGLFFVPLGAAAGEPGVTTRTATTAPGGRHAADQSPPAGRGRRGTAH